MERQQESVESVERSGLLSRGFSFFLGTQFLGAFNDNAFKFLLIGYAMSRLSKEASETYIPLTASMFILPFLVFSGLAGYLSDRYAKRSVMIWTKVLEVAVMVLGLALLWFHAVYGLLAVLFLMGAQSTLFSPGKYGYPSETLRPECLSAGNGLLQLFTFLAIIAGGGVGGVLAERCSEAPWQGALVCVAVAVAGLLTSFGMGRTAAGSASARLSLRPVKPHLSTLREVLSDGGLRFAVIGNTYFWLLATICQTNIAILVKQDMGLGESYMGLLQAGLALGIGVGSVLSGYLSRGRVAYGFVVPGGVMVSAALLCGGFCSSSLWPSLASFAALGTAAGFYQIPLTTCIQQRSPSERLGAVIGACNVLDCVSMLVGTGLHWVMLSVLKLSGGQVLLMMGVLTLVFTLQVLRRLRPADVCVQE